ncbi:MAG: elongation factor P-like protein YeiP [endosymbiont of Galathealinum brachiosum]|uniref:Elongation factor P-like protein YeiP n=1 Tax=endosymbiont of Galathealinum brachiosum TaxID=2200906 RepID=A0A370DIA4_9GAMM|nr:MAG: elongation factor P-like protein YeiP [endosymbiont of Galathealinum brachiosum]
MKANEIKRGSFIHHDGQNIVIKSVFCQTASSRSGNTIYKMKGQVLVTKKKFEHGFLGDENVDVIDVNRSAVQPLYREGDAWVFMDNESYEQYTLADEDIQDELAFLMEGLEGVNALIVEDQIMGIELPASVVLTIEDTAPGIKGASSSARTKPATLSTGLVVQVPEYLSNGQPIKINTETQEYLSRA